METLLEDIKRELSVLGSLSNERGYFLYRDPELFNGDLDEETFKKFLEKYGIISTMNFIKRYIKKLKKFLHLSFQPILFLYSIP